MKTQVGRHRCFLSNDNQHMVFCYAYCLYLKESKSSTFSVLDNNLSSRKFKKTNSWGAGGYIQGQYKQIWWKLV